MFSLGGNKRDSKIWTKKDKNLKIYLVLSGLIILLLLVGCSCPHLPKLSVNSNASCR